MVNLVIEKESSMIFVRTSGPTEFLFRSLPVIFAAPAESHGLLQSCTQLPPARNAPRLTVDYGQPGLFACWFFSPLFSFDNCRTSHFPPRILSLLWIGVRFFFFSSVLEPSKMAVEKDRKEDSDVNISLLVSVLQNPLSALSEFNWRGERMMEQLQKHKVASSLTTIDDYLQWIIINDDYLWLFIISLTDFPFLHVPQRCTLVVRLCDARASCWGWGTCSPSTGSGTPCAPITCCWRSIKRNMGKGHFEGLQLDVRVAEALFIF